MNRQPYLVEAIAIFVPHYVFSSFCTCDSRHSLAVGKQNLALPGMCDKTTKEKRVIKCGLKIYEEEASPQERKIIGNSKGEVLSALPIGMPVHMCVCLH